jgi:hypothetical protein
MQENVSPTPRRIGRTQQLFETALKAGFDQIYKGDVIIKKLKKKHQYKITFSKVYGDRFFFYQVFNKDNTDNVNDQRLAAYITTKNIINEYDTYNNTSKFINKLVFTPTTIMELSNFSRYAFVINKAYFNSHKRLVFMVSTKEINIKNNNLKKLTQIPSGKFKHVRFDVDPINILNLLQMKIKVVFETIKEECKNNPGATQKVCNSPDLKLCDKPWPPYSDDIDNVCKDTTVFDLQKNQSSDCSEKLKEFGKSNTDNYPELLNYFLYVANVNSWKCKGKL